MIECKHINLYQNKIDFLSEITDICDNYKYNMPIIYPIPKGVYNLFIEDNSNIYNCQLFGTIYFGFGSYINSGRIRDAFIGRYCSIGNNVTIGIGAHNYNNFSTSPFFSNLNTKRYSSVKFADPIKKLRVIIHHDVWIGDGAYILNGVTLGIGCVIGCNSVVTKDVPPYAIVAGVPAKIIKYRFNNDYIKKLINSCWWELNPDELKKIAKNLQDNNFQINDIIKSNKFKVKYKQIKYSKGEYNGFTN